MGIDSIDDTPPPGIPTNGYTEDESAFASQIRKDLHRQEMEDRKEARRLRKVYAYLAYSLVGCWMLIIFVLLVAQGAIEGFHLSDQVLMVALGSTTATIVGVPIVVTKYIFRDYTKD